MNFLEKPIQSYVIGFINQWHDIIFPQLKKISSENLVDITAECQDRIGSKLIQDNLKTGRCAYGLFFKNAKGMMEKWELDENGKVKRDNNGRGMVKINDTTVTMVPLDLIVPFITSDEIMPTNPKLNDKPFGLDRNWMAETIKRLGFNPNSDLLFIFLMKPDKKEILIKRFLKEFIYILEGGYLRHRSNLEIGKPRWEKYYPSETLNLTSQLFFLRSVYINPELFK